MPISTIDISTDVNAAAPAGHDPEGWQLTADDPPVVGRINPHGKAPILILGDHAGRAVPSALGRLGLGSAPFDMHIAYDIGIAAAIERLAERLDAPALVDNYSRLVIDPNRTLDDPTSICALSDGVIVPGNRGLAPSDVARRQTLLFAPYHRAIEETLDGYLDRGISPTVLSIHSFTPEMNGFLRPWHIGILWGDNGLLSQPLIAALERHADLVLGDNQPYSGRNMHGCTMETHVYPRGLTNTLVEFRNDLIAKQADARAMADVLADAVEAAMATLAPREAR